MSLVLPFALAHLLNKLSAAPAPVRARGGGEGAQAAARDCGAGSEPSSPTNLPPTIPIMAPRAAPAGGRATPARHLRA